MLITAVVALCYGLHLLSDDATKAGSQGHAFWQKQLYWICNDAIGYTLLIKLVSSVQIGKFPLVALLFAAMIFYDCFFVFASDVMVTVATKIENPMKFIFPRDLVQMLTASGAQPSASEFSMIGFGDVFIPALLASLALRMDFIRAFVSVKRDMAANSSI